MTATEDLPETEYRRAAELLRAHKIVVFPTETVYGLGADARSPQAVAAIFAAKGRPQDNPLIVHVADLDDCRLAAAELGGLARWLLERFAPGPLTVIAPRHPDLAPAVTAGLDTVGIRIPESPLARALLKAAGVPVAAPSANRSGRPSPTSFAMAWAEMAGRADAVLRGPDCAVGVESTIAWPRDERTIHILRPGGVSPEMLRAALDRDGLAAVRVLAGSGAAAADAPKAPGTRYRHYSPRASVALFSTAAELDAWLAAGGGAYALLCPAGFDGGAALAAARAGARLDVGFADLAAYSRLLYRSLVEADGRGCERIAAWLPPAEGLGLALRDRLERAAGRRG